MQSLQIVKTISKLCDQFNSLYSPNLQQNLYINYPGQLIGKKFLQFVLLESKMISQFLKITTKRVFSRIVESIPGNEEDGVVNLIEVHGMESSDVVKVGIYVGYQGMKMYDRDWETCHEIGVGGFVGLNISSQLIRYAKLLSPSDDKGFFLYFHSLLKTFLKN